ncbi:MAG: cysteine--tRNA ligase [Candidatus Magasanikbacteria bacterium RIFOXYD2_FULL_39_9]|uniref:Cysteine--tRNA ligase n=1 Tax=Candidatus Magasanikbacteria bacterium RIFOXYD1_FULL_40_23 TaxID=1798705 RepID=A0A1F6PBS3_9BACT|nr:MAG: cysteine--tRNA ligase [Candidatus Magasanikbacteria bacterium RIFOXYD2_FULL_39_9]OGH93404.1 MAG: cysteine--tRNA ligase [Candidatus Magasanikbacteria bacterium RIFOXYD1_FULL_40_23]
MKIYNTLTRKTEEFKPIKNGRVGVYACGPTVYNFAHIGNLRTYVFEDILKRILLYNDYKVKHIMNITDVGHLTDDADSGEDKMEKGAKREGKTAWQIAKFYTTAFKKDLKDLNIVAPTKFTKATDNIKEQIDLIKTLEKKGFAYKTTDGVYFDTSKLPDYGKLANLKNQELKAGARVEMGEKKNITDFALWKFSPADQKRQMEWLSPWGKGFPGWHIECSAMSAKYLGQPFDIHCGGIDHVPVHHTNEIAQSEAANDKPLANYWLHGEFMLMGEDKMAKSSDNFITLETLKNKNLNPLAYRYLLLQTHYRKQLNFSWSAVEAAQNGLEHLYNIIKTWGRPKGNCEAYEKKFLEAINNDLDTPAALAIMWDLIKDPIYPPETKKTTILKFDKVFGLGLNKIKKDSSKLPASIQKLVHKRNQARTDKNWSESDNLRKEIEALGYIVKDTPEGTKVSKI